MKIQTRAALIMQVAELQEENACLHRALSELCGLPCESCAYAEKRCQISAITGVGIVYYVCTGLKPRRKPLRKSADNGPDCDQECITEPLPAGG